MIKTLKKYQEKAVEKLISRTKELFDENLDKRTIVFQSPTGSGKTFMMSKYIEQVIDELEDKDLVFLWVSIGKGNLHIQSYDSLKKEFQGFPKVHLLEQEYFGTKPAMGKNEIVVVNWEKLRTKDRQTGEWKNILMKDSEKWNFREVIKNTKEEGKTIIMIIDESHSNATSERAKELRDEIIQPDLTIEMSATPVLREGEYNEKVIVQPNDVIEEGMIKKEIIINENIDQISDDEITSQELILEAAYRKRLQLKQLYEQEGSKINPLVLVQIPDGEAGEDKKTFVETFLASKGITYDNHKLAVWLSEEKVNNEKEFVTPNESEVEFLIFKQAIDTGWDCPRAQILVRFREIKSISFEIQTVGRILRMPEAKHYKNELLNKGYVYTNVKSIEVKKETYNPNIIKSIFVKRKDIYTPLQLRSYYKPRIDYGDITSSFYDVLEDVFCKEFGIEKGEYELFDRNRKILERKGVVFCENVEDEIILNKPIDTKNFDHLPEMKIEGRERNLLEQATLMNARLSSEDAYHVFELIIKFNLNGFAPKRSVPTVKQALYRWFRKYLNINLANNGIVYIQSIILNSAGIFSKLLDKAIQAYKPIKEAEKKKKIEELEEWNEEWEIAETRNYNPHIYKPYEYSLSLYISPSDNKTYLNFDSNLEGGFIEFLEQNGDKILWWWQNGNEHMRSNFGIKYLDNNREPHAFQPDFLVMFKDGRLGIFDTKASGDREGDNKLKAEALQKYIKEENKKGKNLWGGIVIKQGQYFRINNKRKYFSYFEKPRDWEYLEF